MTAALSGTLVAIYGILQFLNIDFLAWPEPAFLTHRAFSSLGQPNFLASWLLLVIPPSIYLLVTSRRPLIRFAWSLALASQVIALFLSGSRGGVIALLGVVALFLIYRLALSSWPRRYKYLTVLSFIILALATLWLLNYSSQGRVQELAETDSGSLAVRINLYEAAASAISTHPWLGYGLETGSEVFIKYYTPDWGVYGDVGQSADRAHNLPLDILLVTGAWGLLLFCGLYYFGFNLVRDNLRHNHWAGLTLALAGGLSGYLLSLLFSFSLVSGEIYSWLFLAVLVAINFSGRYPSAVLPAAIPSAVRLRPRKIWLLSWLGLVLVLVTFWQISRTFQDLIVDYYFDQTYKTSGDSDYAYIFQLANYLSLAPAANPINRSSYNYYLADKLNAVYANLTDPALSKLVRTELQILDQNIPANGYQNLTLKARINTLLHNFSLAQQYLTQVLRLAPNWPPAYITQGELAAAAGDKKGALLAYYSASLNLPDPNDPRLNEPHGQVVRGYQYLLDYKIAEIYQQQSDYALAGKYYSLAYQSYPTNFSLLKKIADTYYQRGDLAMAISYNQHGLERNPNDYNWPLALAILYRESGNNSQARNYLQRAIRLAPHNQQLQKLQLEYGH
jgi:tetratricopeptide (TPR) repeat protein